MELEQKQSLNKLCYLRIIGSIWPYIFIDFPQIFPDKIKSPCTVYRFYKDWEF